MLCISYYMNDHCNVRLLSYLAHRKPHTPSQQDHQTNASPEAQGISDWSPTLDQVRPPARACPSRAAPVPQIAAL